MTNATNPENGTVTYVYDNSHHVTSRTDALGSKDGVHLRFYGRLSEVQYYPRGNNNEDTTQRVTYYYDGTFLRHTRAQLSQRRPTSTRREG